MLGVNSVRRPVGEPFASQMREALERAQKGMLNEREIVQRNKDKSARSRYRITWNKNKA